MTHYYTVFGWNVSSEIELTELWKGDSNKKVDVVIKKAKLPEHLEGALKVGIGYQIKPQHYYLKIEKVAKFHVIEGKEIHIDVCPEANIKDVKVYLYASVFGGLCHLKNTLPLHAGAVLHDKKAYLFSGNTGAGKSTTVAALQKRGYTILTDDLAPLKFDSNYQACVSQGISRIKLWGDALDRVGIPYSQKDQIRNDIEKFHAPVERELPNENYVVNSIFILEPYNGEVLSCTELKGKEKLVGIMKHTFRTQLIDGFGLKKAHFEKCVLLINHVRVFRIKQPRQINKLEELVDIVEQHIKN